VTGAGSAAVVVVIVELVVTVTTGVFVSVVELVVRTILGLEVKKGMRIRLDENLHTWLALANGTLRETDAKSELSARNFVGRARRNLRSPMWR